jgi:cyclopropane fatty-acyl-phospholipid synthase-like methyltransferase
MGWVGDKMDARERFELGTRHQLLSDTIEMGPCTSLSLLRDPKRLVFTLSRYKFVAKMLAGMNEVLELGSGDGFGLPIIAQIVTNVHCIDWDSMYIDGINSRLIDTGYIKNATAIVHDINTAPIPYTNLDAIYAIDVIEHFNPDMESIILNRVCYSLSSNGIFIVGTPNKMAAHLATHDSIIGHINLKTAVELKSTMLSYFSNVFLFGMNDEVIHTGHYDMCHYLFALCINPIPKEEYYDC